MKTNLFLSALLAAPLAAQSAYLIDTNLDQLFSVDLTNGATTLIGSTLVNGLVTAADLCWRDDTNEIWTIDLTGGEAGIIDPATGNFTVVWNTTVNGWQGMAWDHTTKLFYLHNQNDQLSTLDPVTGTVTLVGTLAPTTPLVTAIEIDALGRVWAMDFAGAILQIDKATGLEIARIPTPGLTNVQGFSIAADGSWYAVSTGTDSLYLVDPLTGTSTLLGNNPGVQFAKGFVVTGSNLQRGGEACADGGGTVRRMAWTGNSNLGGVVLHGCDAGAIPSVTFLTYGFSTTQVGPFTLPLDMGPFGAPGCKLYQSTDAVAGPIPTGAQAAFAVPNDLGLVGLNVYAQCAILDSSAAPNPAGLVFSDLLKMTITL